MNDIGVSFWMTCSKLSRACAPVCGFPSNKTVCGFVDKRYAVLVGVVRLFGGPVR